MPWVRATLHGQNVYAKAKPDGTLLVERGRVGICYKPRDGRLYMARAQNLTVTDPTPLPDELCGSPLPVKPKTQKTAASGAKSPKTAAEAPTTAPDGSVIAYADGACTGNPGPAGLGVVIVDGDTQIEISEGLGIATNNIAELTAIERALEAVPDPSRPLVIYTDSKYSIGVLSLGWKAKANVELIARLRAHLERRPARFVHVPGHAGIPLNERADALAREGVRSGKKRVEKVARKP